jgi:hypothetical protein
MPDRTRGAPRTATFAAGLSGHRRSRVHEDLMRRIVFYCHAERVKDPW